MMEDKDLYSGLIRLHVLHHACHEPIFGAGIMEELARHGYRLSPGTLYPLLHGLEEKGYLRSSGEGDGRQARRVYRATPKGRKALAAAKVKVRELFSELLEDEPTPAHLENSPLRKTSAEKDRMRELSTLLKLVTLPKLRDGASNVKDSKAQALLETSAEVVEGLIKAFENYNHNHRKRKRSD
jgi:DNA-binding PadR family transcriptional regulator